MKERNFSACGQIKPPSKLYKHVNNEERNDKKHEESSINSQLKKKVKYAV